MVVLVFIVSYEWVACLHSFTVLAQKTLEKIVYMHKCMPLFLYLFHKSEPWNKINKCSMDSWVISRLITMGSSQVTGSFLLQSEVCFIVGQYPACRFTCSGAESARRIFPLIAKLRPPIWSSLSFREEKLLPAACCVENQKNTLLSISFHGKYISSWFRKCS